jgi:hypothetical protein
LDIDVNKCGQVLRNLVSNALKFTPAGGTVKLVCTLLTSLGEPLTEIHDSLADQDAVHFRFEVFDTGPGMSVVSASELFLHAVVLRSLTDIDGYHCFQENQQKLFNNIVQFDAVELQGGGGSGLGLWSEYNTMPCRAMYHCS